MGRLTDIANRHTVDKGTEHYEKHGYTEVYDKYIPENGEFVLLEIGVWHGDSLRMWKEYNPQLTIHGVDIDKNVRNFVNDTDGVSLHIGDQSDVKFMEDVIRLSGSPNFIIDDGSHHHSHIIESFKILWEHLQPKGFYFIEDLHAPHAQRDVTMQDILDWLIFNDIKYSSIDLTCDDKLLIIQK